MGRWLSLTLGWLVETTKVLDCQLIMLCAGTNLMNRSSIVSQLHQMPGWR